MCKHPIPFMNRVIPNVLPNEAYFGTDAALNYHMHNLRIRRQTDELGDRLVPGPREIRLVAFFFS